METTALKMFTDTVKVEGGHIFIKPICDFFEIHYRNQALKIKSDPKFVPQVRFFALEKLFGDTRDHLSLTKNGFLIWILSINVHTVREDLRGNFIKYQTFISDYLFGSAEEQENISRLNETLQSKKLQYSELGNSIKKTQAELTDALNQRYQYLIDFTSKKELI